MPDDAAVAVGAASGAGSGAPAGGAGAAPAAEPPAPAAPQTDEQILGIEPIGAEPAAEPVQEPEQQPDAQPADAAEPAQDAAAKIAEDGRLMPVKWREMAKNDPEFRTMFYEHRAAKEKLATIEPQFNEFQTKLAAVEKADQAYLSGDPAAIQSELQGFIADKPAALLPMLQAGENLLKTALPQEYARIQSERLTETLKSNNFGNVFQVLRNAIEAGDQGLDVLKQQVSKILDWADGNGFPTTEKAMLAQQKAQLDARDAAHRQQEESNYNAGAKTFRDTVNSKLDEQIKSEIKTSMDKMLEKSAFADGAKARIAADTLAEIYKLLGAKADITDQIGQAIWPKGSKAADGSIIRGNFNDANRELAIRLPAEYAKSVLADTLKKVVEQYTKDFMAAADKTKTKAAAAASRVDLSGGSPAQRAPKPLTKKDVDYGKMDDQAILNA